MRLHDVEPVLGPESVAPISRVVGELLGRPRETPGPFMAALDGRSSNGKTSLAARMAAALDEASVVHTDDVAWNYSFFDWADLVATEIIEPLRAGRSIAYRPPGYATRTDPVEIVVSADAPLVIIEGVGSARTELAALLDAVVWVQSDLELTDERNRIRVEAGEMDPPTYADWIAEEIAFQAAERTWERADLVVCGTPTIAHDPETEVVILRGLPRVTPKTG